MSGGYGRNPTMETDLGIERLCRGCGEYWPVDDEFWFFTTDRHGKRRITGRCKACVSERPRDASGRRRYDTSLEVNP